jgi:putative ABC transport system permease protein
VGGAVGLACAWGAITLLKTAAPGAIPRIDEVGIDARVLVFTLGASILTGVLISLVPALRAFADRSFDALKAGGRTPAYGAARGARRVLVVAEVALAVVALTGAGMLLRSLWHLQSADMGFDPRNVLTARVSIAPREYNDARTVQFYQQVLERIRATPGVTAAGAAGWLPVVDAGGLWGIIPEGRAYGPESGNPENVPMAVPQQATPGYLSASGIRLVAGRDFTDADREDAPLVAIVSEGMAKQVWPGDNAIGKRFRVGGNDQLQLAEIVGIVKDIRSRGFTDTPEPTMYFPLAQTARTTFFMPRAMALIVRTSGDPFAVTGAVKSAVHTLDPAAPVSEIRSMDQVIGTSVATRKFSTTLLTVFSLLALTLAGIGTYGVIAYGVAQRTYEIGVRMALGAEQGSVVRLVMAEGLRMCGVGIGIGLIASVILARSIRTMLVGVPSIDAVSLVATTLALLTVAVLATMIPARRALGVSPTEALRGG